MTDQTETARDQTALTEAERAMLTYALDQAQERIWSEGGFTGEDQAAVTSLRRLAEAQQDETPCCSDPTCACVQVNAAGRCECATWDDAPAREAQQDKTPRQWCKCRSCWGWFVEEHPGEDLDELGRDLSWWSGLPEHRDAPAGVARQEPTQDGEEA